MKKNCTICNNNSFILTQDLDCISIKEDIDRSEDCSLCTEIQRQKCKELIDTLNKDKKALKKIKSTEGKSLGFKFDYDA